MPNVSMISCMFCYSMVVKSWLHKANNIEWLYKSECDVPKAS